MKIKSVFCFLCMLFTVQCFAGGNTEDCPCRTNFSNITGFGAGNIDVEYNPGSVNCVMEQNNSVCGISAAEYTCRQIDGVWLWHYEHDSNNNNNDSAHIVSKRFPSGFDADGALVCEDCGTDKYNAFEYYERENRISNNRLNICCDKYELVVEENGLPSCREVASEKGSFYLYGKEVKCRDEGSFPRKLEEGPVSSEQEEYTENGYVCRYCPIGYYCDGYKKMVCPAGTFTSTIGHSVDDDYGGCITCSTNGYFCPGAITENNNGWKNADDKDISYITSIKSAAFPNVALNPEQYSGYEIICPEGYYTNRNTGYGHCQKCPAGRTTDGEGQSSCDAYKYTDMNFTKTGSNSGWKWPSCVKPNNSLYNTYTVVSQN